MEVLPIPDLYKFLTSNFSLIEYFAPKNTLRIVSNTEGALQSIRTITKVSAIGLI